MMTPEFIPFYGPEGLIADADTSVLLSKHGRHWRDPSDPFGNPLSILLSPAGDDYTATVFYAGHPLLLVTAGSASAHEENGRWTDYEWHGVSAEPMLGRAEIEAMFCHLVGGIGEDALEAFFDSGATDFNEWLADYEGTDVDDGHELVSFVGTVAWAMWDWVSLNDNPLPVSPDQLGWNR